MTDGQEYGKQIAKKMLELQKSFRTELDPENDYYARALSRNDNDDEQAADECAESEDFIMDYLYTEIMELAKVILKADVYGMFTAGFVPFAKSREEYRQKEQEQTISYYRDLNKELAACCAAAGQSTALGE